MVEKPYWKAIRKVTTTFLCGWHPERSTHDHLEPDPFSDVSDDSTSPLLTSQEASGRPPFYQHDAYAADLANLQTELSSLTNDSASSQASIDGCDGAGKYDKNPPNFALEMDNAGLRREVSRLCDKNKELEEELTLRAQVLQDQSPAIQEYMDEVGMMKEEKRSLQAESQSWECTIKNHDAKILQMTDEVDAARRQHREAIQPLEDENSTMRHLLHAYQEAASDSQRSSQPMQHFERHGFPPLANLIPNLIRQTPFQTARAFFGSLINHTLALTLWIRRFWYPAAPACTDPAAIVQMRADEKVPSKGSFLWSPLGSQQVMTGRFG